MAGIDANARLYLLLNNNVTDDSQYSVAVTNNSVTFSATNPKFAGKQYGIFDGSSSYLSAGNANSWNYLHNTSALWTIDYFVKVASFVDSSVMFDTGTRSSAFIGAGFAVNSDRSLTLNIRRGVPATGVVGGSFATLYPNDTTGWHHIAITYDQSLASANATLYIDGVNSGTLDKTLFAPTDSDATHPLIIGDSDLNTYFPGRITGFRVSDSIRYTGNFTPPTVPYDSTPAVAAGALTSMLMGV